MRDETEKMKMIFIQGGTRLKIDNKGDYYTDGNLNNKIWDRYKRICSELIIILRKDDKIYKEQYAKKEFNRIDTKGISVVPVFDLMRPKTRFVSINHRRAVKKAIYNEVKKCDKAIIRSALNYYTLTAVKACRKYEKPYLVETTGYAFEGYWHHGDIYGKIVAIPYEMMLRKAVKDADYCLYVTNEVLQKRYPCKGFSMGCSDVEITIDGDNILEERIKRYSENMERIVLGTIGGIDVKLKGQKDVIKALWRLKKRGITNFEYQLVGLGDDKYMRGLIDKYGLGNQVKIIGGMPHEEVFKWLKDVDIYIHPSHIEGLCRAIIEAMSMACPIIASDAGGNIELSKIIYNKGDIGQLTEILKNISAQQLIREAKRSFDAAKKYDSKKLNERRMAFYNKFVEGAHE